MKDGKCVGKLKRFYLTPNPSPIQKRSRVLTILTQVIKANHE